MQTEVDARRTRAAVATATLAAAAMIAQQVGSKATRDALFLEIFDVSLLPRALTAAVVVSLVAMLSMSRLLARFGPQRVVPVAFAVSAAFQLALFGLAGHHPALVAVLFYLHVASFGAVLVSGFWSVVNERFDPNTARYSMARIATGATVGGVLGGVLATLAGRWFGSASLLPLLAILHLASGWALLRASRGVEYADSTPRQDKGALAEGLRVVARQPYLQNLVALLIVVTAAAACLDYVFKDFAQQHFAQPQSRVDLVTFFGVFHTAQSVLTLALQSLVAAPLLARAGLARTAAALPAGLGLGSVILLAFPVWTVAAVVRAFEGGLRSSLFRSAYEPLFTPLAEADKRAGKSIIDVGGERLGDALGAGLVQLSLVAIPWIAGAELRQVLLLAAMGLTAIALVLTRRLHRGYVRTLESSLLRQHIVLDESDAHDSVTRTVIMRTLGARSKAQANDPKATPVPREHANAADDPILRVITELRSHESPRVLRALAHERPLHHELVGHAIALLAWDSVADDVIDALRATGRRSWGALLDVTLDPSADFALRRRAPRAIHCLDGQAIDAMVVHGLASGLSADRFEIRFQCARTLVRIGAASSSSLDRARVMDRVVAEVSVADVLWRSHRLLDRPREDLLLHGHALAHRASPALQNVFTLLALVLPPEPLQIALQGLMSPNGRLRGTALEYLESVLPTRVREGLWARLNDEAPSAERPSSTEQTEGADVLRTYMQTQVGLRETLDAALEESERRGDANANDSA